MKKNFFDKARIVSEERQKENEVIAWWIKNFPQSKNVFDFTTDGWDKTERIGIYILIGNLVLEFYDKAHNSNELKNFLNLYNQFILEFKGKFLEDICQWLPENSEVHDSIIAMVCTEMGEGTFPQDYDYVLNLMPEGPLKEEFIRFVNWNNYNK